MLFSRFCTSCFGELIDTLWNVNFTQFKVVESKREELIDTLWNVNTEAPAEPVEAEN